MMCRDKKR